jgi:hypothetical protein
MIDGGGDVEGDREGANGNAIPPIPHQSITVAAQTPLCYIVIVM